MKVWWKHIFRAIPRYRSPVFILGTGRSGTHWIGRILASHPVFRVTIEKEPVFSMVTRMATHPSTREKILPMVLRSYTVERLKALPFRYADKSHPNIWLADRLAEKIPNARFLGIVRNPYAVVASMLRHDGVLSWIENWRELPHPNRFLGTNELGVEKYEKLSVAARCALRWESHRKRMEELASILDDRLYVILYERLVSETQVELNQLAQWLALEDRFPKPQVLEESLYQWRQQLSDEEKNAVADIVGIPPSQSIESSYSTLGRH